MSTSRIIGLSVDAFDKTLVCNGNFGHSGGTMRYAMDLGYLKEVGLKVGKINSRYPEYPTMLCKTPNVRKNVGSKSK